MYANHHGQTWAFITLISPVSPAPGVHYRRIPSDPIKGTGEKPPLFGKLLSAVLFQYVTLPLDALELCLWFHNNLYAVMLCGGGDCLESLGRFSHGQPVSNTFQDRDCPRTYQFEGREAV